MSKYVEWKGTWIRKNLVIENWTIWHLRRYASIIFLFNQAISICHFIWQYLGPKTCGSIHNFQKKKIQNKLTEGVGFPWMIHVRWASLFSPEWTLSVSSSISGGSAKIACNLRFRSFFLHRQKAYRHSCVQYFLPK